MKITRTLAIALESVGIMGIIAGVVLEAVLHAPIGLILISGASAIVATGSLIWAKILKKH